MLTPKNLHPYQRRAAALAIQNDRFGLFLGMGLGKTISSLTAFNELKYNRLDVMTALVIAPRRVVESVWRQEVAQWSHTQHLTVIPVVGTAKKRAAALDETADIYLISRDNVVWLCDHLGGSLRRFDMLIIDELSSFKNPSAKRFKALKKASAGVNRVIGLTGTPAPNGYRHLWAQIFLLDRGARLGETFSAFARTYLSSYNNGTYTTYSTTKAAEQQIEEDIKDICVSMSAEDYLTLPPVRVHKVIIEMPPALAKAYKAFERDKVLELNAEMEARREAGEVVVFAESAAALSSKLRQFASGSVYDEEHNAETVHALKVEALRDVIEEAQGASVLVAREFKSTRDTLMQAFRRDGIRELKSDKDVVEWNAGKVPILTMHPASGGHGTNLQPGGHIAYWFDLTWDLELWQQFNARLARQGQQHPVTLVVPIVKGTIDEKIMLSCEAKGASQAGLLDAVKDIMDTYLND